MKLSDLTPHMLAIKAVGYLLIASVLVFSGCRWQAKLDAGEIVEARAKTERAGTALKAAAAALREASAKFREIDTASAENVASAARKREQAEGEAKAAKDDAQAFKRQRDRLQAQADREAKQCPAGNARICGDPLR